LPHIKFDGGTAPTTSSSSITGNPPAPVMRRTQAVVPAVMMGMPNAQPGPALAPNPALAAAAMQQQVYSDAMASQSAAAAMAGTGWGWLVRTLRWLQQLLLPRRAAGAAHRAQRIASHAATPLTVVLHQQPACRGRYSWYVCQLHHCIPLELRAGSQAAPMR